MNSEIRREFRYTFRLSIPIIIGLVGGQALFGIIDTLMIGNMLGEQALAAATLGNNLNWIPLLLSIGLCVAIPVLTAQARGAGTHEKLPEILRHGLLISLIAGILGSALLCVFVYFNGLNLLGQPEQICAGAKNFSCLIALSIPVAAGFQAVKSFRDANNGQWIALLWTIVGLIANVFLNWVFMSGSLGFPNWGLEGAAAGTLFARILSFAGIVFHERLVCEFKKGFSLESLKANLRISIPSSLHVLCEAGIFIAAPFFMGWINEASIAANQVAMTISSLVYMVPLGLSQALSIRIGEAYGKREFTRVRGIFSGAMIFILVFMGACALGFSAFREEIPLLFNLGTEASKVAASFIVIACAYMLFDGVQTVAAGALRGLSDVRIIAVASFVSYWAIACPLALLLAFPVGLHGIGVWIGLAVGLAIMALILGLRMLRTLRKNG